MSDRELHPSPPSRCTGNNRIKHHPKPEVVSTPGLLHVDLDDLANAPRLLRKAILLENSEYRPRRRWRGQRGMSAKETARRRGDGAMNWMELMVLLFLAGYGLLILAFYLADEGEDSHPLPGGGDRR